MTLAMKLAEERREGAAEQRAKDEAELIAKDEEIRQLKALLETMTNKKQ